MRCEECDFWRGNGGTCTGLVKNQEAKVPFYVCPHAEELAAMDQYWGGAASKHAGTSFTSVLPFHDSYRQRASGAVPAN